MKYISFVVPSYNSENYLNKCIDSLLIGGEDVEIIIVNDGSKDRTIDIANEYQRQYPSIVRVIDKENGGHGSGINAGLEIAQGIYYKCVDSDDWVDKDAYLTLLETVKKHYEEGTLPDLYFTNYVYERLDINVQVPMRDRFMPRNQIFTWKEMKKFALTEYLFLHQTMYKLDVIKESGMKLPHHCFYVDNIYVHVPLFNVKTMYYCDVDFYRYYVGRPNQSVTLENVAKNYKMSLRVMHEISSAHTLKELKSLPRNQYRYLIHDIMAKEFLTLFHVNAISSKEKDKHLKMYYKHFKETNRELYNKIHFRTPFIITKFLFNPIKRKVILFGYKQVIKKTNWN